MKKQSLLEYMKDNLHDMQEWLKMIWICFICATILIFITVLLTFLFVFVLCLFISNSTIITLLGTLFFLAILLGFAPIAIIVISYFI